jgi:hypothetical protein
MAGFPFGKLVGQVENNKTVTARIVHYQIVAKKPMPAERRSPWHANCNDVGIQTSGQFNEHCGF